MTHILDIFVDNKCFKGHEYNLIDILRALDKSRSHASKTAMANYANHNFWPWIHKCCEHFNDIT